MAVNLYKHNEDAYNSALKMLNTKGKAAVIHPTGTGKSFIGFKLCENFPDKTVCWLSPSDYIFKTQLENLKKASDGYEPRNIKFFTYAKLMNMSGEEIAEIKPNFIILDEFHRCGAEMWGEGVQRLLAVYSSVPVLGLTATNIRYLDNRRDMADELFDGNVASEMTLGEAIVRGILNPPKYVLSVFSYQNSLEKYQKRISKAKSKAARDAGEKYLEALKRALEKAEGIDEIFHKHIPDRAGKYIVFCSNIDHMREMIELSSDWFKRIDQNPHIYSAYSNDPETSREFSDFKADNSEHLKLLYCIDMLNEGIHIENVSGVILLRPTVSPIIYKQQIGRALSASKDNDAVIFDIVLNIENLYSVDAIEEEMQVATAYYRFHGDDNAVVNEHFKIIDEVKECKKLFDKLEGVLSSSWDIMYTCAEEYYRENGNLNVPKRYITSDGYTLGSWLNTQRSVYSGRVKGNLSDAQIQKLEAIGMRWENMNDIKWNTYYKAAQKYYEEHGNLRVPVTEEEYDGVNLARWISQLRNYRKNGTHTATLTPERISDLDKIGMIWDVPDYLWEKYYNSAVLYHREYGNLDVPSYYVDKSGIKLGAWISALRSARKNKNTKRAELTNLQIAKLDELGMLWDGKTELNWEKFYQEACRYYKMKGNLKVPAGFITDTGCRLGRWIHNQRDKYPNSLSKEKIKRLEAIGMIWRSEDSWEQKFKLVKKYYDKFGNINMPADYVDEGVWVARWLSEQIARFNGKVKGKELTAEQSKMLKSVGVVKNKSRLDIAWEEQYSEAKKYYSEHGNLNVPKNLLSKNGKNIHIWLEHQKENKRKGKLSREKTDKLNELGIVWDNEPPWEIGFRHAKEYYDSFGNLLVPIRYICPDGYKLGAWLTNQRTNLITKDKQRKLSQDKIDRLNSIGMIWSIVDAKWYQNFEEAKKYYKKNNDISSMPRAYKTSDGQDLFAWLESQKCAFRDGKLSPEKTALLNELKIDWLLPKQRAWENAFSLANNYLNEYGNLMVPAAFKCENGFMLGVWIRGQRKNKEKLTPQQIDKLDAINMIWD